ncbi:hypothetical protein CEP54_015325 [Fusarium duplospermum]|uniref:Uncharacterized protein n=1 Tax=Fusarium duplospermum TaxID=1325734 RepID=A0A428NPW4_9HYPO|nr:hypothetical protein CEP54_015325 [Fusarium duplospermum]
MPPQQTSQSTNSQSTTSSATSSSGTASSGSKPPSRYRVVKDGWGDRPTFQASYGLGMDPTSIEEGNEIIDAMIKHEYGYNDNKER